MTNAITLNVDLLDGLERGTDEYGQANLKMVMNFALEVVRDISLENALAAVKGELETPVIYPTDLAKYITVKLFEQSHYYAELWSKVWGSVLPNVIMFWAECDSYNYIQEDGSIWVDIEELHAEMTAAKAS